MTDRLRGRVRVRLGLLMAGTLAALVALSTAGPALASGVVTCPPGTGADVQNAINSGGTVTINGRCHGNFVVTTNVTIQGGSPGATLDGDGAAQVLWILGGITVTIRNLTITNGSYILGGGIDMDASTGQTVNLVSSTVTGNHANLWGGGIYVHVGGTLKVTNSTIAANSAGFGGGIAADQGLLTVTGSSITGNTASFGGGIRISGTERANVTASTVASNVATSTQSGLGGGGIWVGNAFLTMAGSRVSWNTSAVEGGGIAYYGHSTPQFGVSLTDTTIDHNTAESSGGGIYSDSSFGDATLSLERTTVSFNRVSDGDGGGISTYGKCGHTASLVATNSFLGGNLALDGEGGALYISNGEVCLGPGTAVVALAKTSVGKIGLSVNPNQARYGGGIFNENSDGFSSLSVQAGSSVVHNKASVNGGGIFNCSPALLLITPPTSVLLNSPNNVLDTTICP